MNTKNKNVIIKLSILAAVVLITFAVKPLLFKETSTDNNYLYVYFINTGQSDCILITTPNDENILIDSGDNGDEDIVLGFLEDKKITKLEYVIFTHPHSDHIGGGYEVVSSFDVDNVIMPDIENDTKTYKSLVDEIDEKNIKVTYPDDGDIYNIDGITMTILSPVNSDYGTNMNEYSIVCRLDYGESSFLFTGDAEAVNEEEMIEAGYDLDVDVLKVGHHGSSSSSTKEFLEAVTPEYAVILCGKDNSYNHPNDDTLSKLEEVSAEIYRTDINGTITMYSDGKTITVALEKKTAKNSEYYIIWAGSILPNIYYNVISIYCK
ncbi:MAG: hypothetical protein A2Y17_02375 [Clostridiales bacterium GWF2_38_85]|nr:MAG: hypothetical protein A2Y17_02375 [Clostridiales bacterium GWF2_38_85]